ncbi:Membrane insertase OXA1/ALB3/YidC [Kalmanozyma brasiliensis GHG001]|uniref:Membrane insertase YidC/Oxa/ALB C-terminal domain-containing protein n=1 Tax=Kalmanozyma brasiliensis (strain GHG001) TaxID=1365824 RepID=V5ESM4_KALBG|nr:Membrane insertase OXA1/ALB3/YidC [Kalmanozyma brasiliensis GHG001]EST05968.1 Membrane insertase OXA1/ALB3/YidC [Kalmanozyma brasiliensis GHG001]
MVGGAVSLAQRVRLRSASLLVQATLPSTRTASTSRGFSAAASASPRIARVSPVFVPTAFGKAITPALLAGKPFSSSIAHRSLSFWGSSNKSSTDASTVSSQLESKKDEAVEAVSELKQSTETHLRDAGSSVSDSLQSTQQSANDAVSTLQTKASSLTSDLTQTFSNVDPTATATLTETFGSAAGIKAGELSELGLNHWVTPPGWITNLLEFVGTHTGLPWWGTIVVTTLALRLLISPINVAGQKNAIRLGNIQPEMKRHMDDVKHYKAAGDQANLQQAVQATQRLLRENNANPLGSIIPILVQFPLMFSFFLALERIAKSGSETFAHGGPWWTMDLTQPDPTWILPAVSTLATFAVAELGFKVGTNNQSDPNQSTMIKYVFRGAMPLIGWFSTTFPSGVLVYWATTNLYSLLQLAVLQIPIVRQWARFPKRIQHPKNPYANEPKTFMDKLRAAKDQMSDSSATQRAVKPVVSATSAKGAVAAGSRSDALKEILDDKAAYEASSPIGDKEAAAAQKNRERVLKARQRRAKK